MSKNKYSVYFSHSWRPEDVDLNLNIWEVIHEHCTLMVDEDLTAEPPYYVNRIEEYIRRSDLFLATLPYRADQASVSTTPPGSDTSIRCSHPALFEIRLAERARKPRLILYDTRTKFRPISDLSEHVVYTAFEPEHLKQGATYVRKAIRDWLEAVASEYHPRIIEPNQNALILLPQSPERDALHNLLKTVLVDVGYQNIQPVKESVTDVEVVSQLFSSSLLVADVSVQSLWDIYAMAHALFVPTIRLARDNGETLPWFLRGHPYGYQEDIVRWTTDEELQKTVCARATAMRDTRRVITEFDVGRDFLERRRFTKRHRVFISHNLKDSDRQVVEAIVKKCSERSISYYEYKTCNVAAELWPQRLTKELENTSHALVILSDDYELSEACDDELEALLRMGDKVEIYPYLFGTRSRHNPKLGKRKLNHETLKSDAEAAALQVVDRLLPVLTSA